MLNIAVIGCGMVSHGHFLAIRGSSTLRLAAVVDTSRERAAAASDQYGPCPVYTDYRDALQLPDLDAVVVATHVETHYEITLAALRRGLHVLCEKPMADSPARCAEMVAEARKAGRLLVVNFNSRSSPHYRIIKEMIDAGKLGTLRVIRIVYDWSCHDWQPPERMEHFMRAGGPIVDSGVHFFDAIRWFANDDIDAIDARGVVLPPWEAPQHVIATCRMRNGVVALVEAGWLFTRRAKDRGSLYEITVIGDQGSIHWDDRTNRMDCYLKDETIRHQDIDAEKHFDIVHERFAESIKQGHLTDLASGHDGELATIAALRAVQIATSTA